MIEIELWLDFQSSAPQGRELLAVVGVDGEAVVGVGVAGNAALTVVVTDGELVLLKALLLLLLLRALMLFLTELLLLMVLLQWLLLMLELRYCC